MKKYIIKIRSGLLVFLTHHIGLPILKQFRKPNITEYAVTDLSNFPKGSLGFDLYLFLKKRNLAFDKHYTRHDLKHVLLQYDTTDYGEACLQCFMLGNGRVSIPVLFTIAFSFFTMPDYWKDMFAAYKKGNVCSPVHNWQWKQLLIEQTIDLRTKLYKS